MRRTAPTSESTPRTDGSVSRAALRAVAARRSALVALVGLGLLVGGCSDLDRLVVDPTTVSTEEPLPEPFETVDRTLDELARTEDGSEPLPGSREELVEGLGAIFEGGVRGLGQQLEVLVDEGSRVVEEILEAERRSRPSP